LSITTARNVRHEAANVASVPKRSPFRYPGGKTWLVPIIRSWLWSKPAPPMRLVEPFAGGAIVSLTVAFERLAQHVIFGEIDEGVAAVWRTILGEDAEWLCARIRTFSLTLDSVRRALAEPALTARDLAFQTLLRNRVQRGGIMAAGAGLLKAGENGHGLRSRWYPRTLVRRIREIHMVKHALAFVEGDGFELVRRYQLDPHSAFYIDPPYTLAARRLYSRWAVDHQQLFSMLRQCKGDFLMSYDRTDEIEEMAMRHGFETRTVAMTNTHHAKMTELLIGRDLGWLDAAAMRLCGFVI
jgi:DNA adenine methylase